MKESTGSKPDLQKKVYFWPEIKIFADAHQKNANLQQIALFTILCRHYFHIISYDLSLISYKGNFQ